eukprot:1351243-Amorphochlora_amoeboformis.AAC.1
MNSKTGRFGTLSLRMVDELPDIEWWDEKVLGLNSSYDDFNQETVPTSVTIKIHHPVPLAPPCEEEPPGPRPLMLTKKERKKIRSKAINFLGNPNDVPHLRRMNKLEKERERQDLVSAGLAPPKEPRCPYISLFLSFNMKIHGR